MGSSIQDAAGQPRDNRGKSRCCCCAAPHMLSWSAARQEEWCPLTPLLRHACSQCALNKQLRRHGCCHGQQAVVARDAALRVDMVVVQGCCRSCGNEEAGWWRQWCAAGWGSGGGLQCQWRSRSCRVCVCGCMCCKVCPAHPPCFCTMPTLLAGPLVAARLAPPPALAAAPP